MIRKLWNKWFGKIEEEPVTEVRFIFHPEQVVDLTVNWKPGEEKAFAELLYALNSGILLEHTLAFTKAKCTENGQTHSYTIMVNHLNRLFEEESKLLAQFQNLAYGDEENEDSPVVSPSDVFGGKHDNALTSEGQDDEI